MSEFSVRLDQACKDIGITQRELSQVLEVSPSTVNGWIKGTREPDVAMIKRLAETLKVNLDWLIGNNAVLAKKDAKKEQLIANYELLNSEAQSDLVAISEALKANPKNLKSTAVSDTETVRDA